MFIKSALLTSRRCSIQSPHILRIDEIRILHLVIVQAMGVGLRVGVTAHVLFSAVRRNLSVKRSRIRDVS